MQTEVTIVESFCCKDVNVNLSSIYVEFGLGFHPARRLSLCSFSCYSSSCSCYFYCSSSFSSSCRCYFLVFFPAAVPSSRTSTSVFLSDGPGRRPSSLRLRGKLHQQPRSSWLCPLLFKLNDCLRNWHNAFKIEMACR